MRARRHFLAASVSGAVAIGSLCAALPVAARAQASAAAVLRVDASDGRTTTWSLAQLKALPPETARAATRDGAVFEARGVFVATLLKQAGLDLSASLGSAPVVGVR